MHDVGAVQMVLDLLCSETSEIIDEIFPQLLHFSNRLLDGADNDVQKVFTDYLCENESALNLFERCYHCIEKEIGILQK